MKKILNLVRGLLLKAKKSRKGSIVVYFLDKNVPAMFELEMHNINIYEDRKDMMNYLKSTLADKMIVNVMIVDFAEIDNK